LQSAPPPDTAIFSDDFFSVTLLLSVRNAPDLSLPTKKQKADLLYGVFESGH
jgi:hypothetical protein